MFLSKNKIAVFIDGDNLSPDNADFIVDYANHLGSVSIKRVYGTPSTIVSWTSKCKKLGLRLVNFYNTKPGKNGADIALAIDAVLYASKSWISKVIIASNDSDFLPLALKLKEMGKEVYSMGIGTNYSEPYKAVCDYYVPLPAVKKKKKGKKTQAFKTQSEENKVISFSIDSPSAI